MIKKSVCALMGCLASLAASGSAHAEHFDFDPGMGAIFDPDLAYGDGKPYEWVYQDIALDFTSPFTDGRENTLFQDDPSGNIPYILFDGTDASTAGHCLELAFKGPNADSLFANAVRNLRLSYTDSTGVDRMLFNKDTSLDSYGAVRVWIQNTGPSLHWRLKISDLDGNDGSWNQSATMDIWRLDESKADCTTNALATAPFLTFVTITGSTGNYTMCDQAGSCHTGG